MFSVATQDRETSVTGKNSAIIKKLEAASHPSISSKAICNVPFMQTTKFHRIHSLHRVLNFILNWKVRFLYSFLQSIMKKTYILTIYRPPFDI